MTLLAWALFLAGFPLGYRLRAARPESVAPRVAAAYAAVLAVRIIEMLLDIDLFRLPVVVVEILVVSAGAGLVGGTALARSGRRARVVWLALIFLSLVASALPPLRGTRAFWIVPFAFATGWTREVRGASRLGLALLTFLLFVMTLGNRAPDLPIAGSLYTAWVVPALFPIVYLGLHGLLASFRLAAGFRLRVRRIGRRLVVSHLLALLVPSVLLASFVLLTAMASIASYRAESAVRYLDTRDAESRAVLRAMLSAALEEAGNDPGAIDPDAAAGRIRIPFDREGIGVALILTRLDETGAPRASTVSLSTAARKERREEGSDVWLLPPATWLARPRAPHGLSFVEGRLLFTVREEIGSETGGSGLRADLVREIAGARLSDLEAVFSVPVRFRPLLDVETEKGVKISPTDEETTRKWRETEHRWKERGLAGDGAMSSRSARVPGATLAGVLRYDDSTGTWSEKPMVLTSRAGWLDLVAGIASFRENRMNLLPILLLLVIALLFLIVVGVVLGTVASMNRAIADSLRRLTGGAQKLREGDLGHRIEVVGADELALLGEEFNRMAEGLEEGRRLAIEKERVEQELAIAREIQEKLLPAGPPEIAGLEVTGTSRPAREVGGDYYDFLLTGGDDLVLAIADVSGKGVPAALLMSSLRASLHAEAAAGFDPARAAARLNGFLHASTRAESFITGLIGKVDAAAGKMIFANAGHEPPLLLRADGTLEEIGGGDLMLGAFPDATYEDREIRLARGDLLLLYTDGVTEAMNDEKEFYGSARLGEATRSAAGQTAAETIETVVRSVARFTAGAEPSDDITLVAMRKV